jgi:hypothetical protein
VWWVGAKPVDIYLGSRRIVVPDAQRGLRAIATNSVDEGLDRLARELKVLPARSAVRFWLSGGLCRPFVVPPVVGVTAQSDRQRIARSLAQQDTGLAQPEVWLESRRGTQACTAACAQADVLQRLRDVLKTSASRARLRRIAPWWAELLRHSLRRQRAVQAVVVRDCDAVTVLAGTKGEFVAVSALTPVFDQQAADDATTRLLLPLGVQPSDVVRWSLALTEVGADPWRGGLALGALAEERP